MKLNRLSLNVVGLNRIGLNQIGSPSRGSSSGTDRPYIDPEVLASLKAVCICYGKSNDDPDRAVVKNLVDPDNPFVISNAAYDKMSSYGGYEFAKFDNTLDWYNTEGNDSVVVVSRNGHSITLKRLTGPNFWYFQNSTFRGLISNVIPFKVNSNKNITVIWDVHGLSISEGKDKSVRVQELVLNPNEDNYTNLKTLNEEELAQIDISTNSLYYLLWFDLSTLAVDEEVTIEMLPLFEGAFVTDGIDDLITSTKTVQEMLGGSNEITVVSMIHQVKDSSNNVSFTNYIRGSANGYFRNIVNNYDKTGIYGYTSSDLMALSVVNNILGDKNDYTSNGDNRDSIINGNFSVQGYSYNDGNNTGDFSSVAWYWTIIANKVLTTDEINQVIAYFNLDRCVELTVLYDVKKQGLSNDTPDSDWYLKDFSKNGFDMSLFNFAKKGGSGVSAKQGETIRDYSIIPDEDKQTLTIYNEFKYKIKSTISERYWAVQYINKTDTSYPVTIVTDKDAFWVNSITYYDADNNRQVIRKEIAVPANTPTNVLCCGYDQFDIPEDATSIVSAVSYINLRKVGEITVEFIPSCKDGLITDGVNDFGKVTGMPIYKDYTIVVDYERLKINIGVDSDSPILSKSESVNLGAFIFNTISSNGDKVSYSFGLRNIINTDDTIRKIFYQSKYINDGQDINIDSRFVDSDKLWLGTYRDSDYRFIAAAIYSLMTFPYSMSEFLIERQLKKHKLGTLYPDMVEWRPIIKSNVEYASISYLLRIPGQGTVAPVIGQYYPILSTDTSLVVYVATNGVDEVANLTINGQEPTSSSIHVDGRFKFEFPFNNSPQKINITIDEYIRYEDIVQPYPSFVKLENLDRTYTYTWGDKLKVGDTIRYNSSVNLLEGAYTLKGQLECNGVYVYDNNQYITVAKEMIFAWTNSPIWSIDDNEPKCILSPRLLRIPNSSYKILGYIPDISGHGNHGKINNSAYAEGSGVNEDGSYQFDGVDDFITIPTTVGGKQVLMKVNWQSIAGTAILYDQRTNGGFAIFNRDFDTNENKVPAYRARNIGGSTYIDGILNKYIYASELKNITHNIVELHDPKLNIGTLNPKIGSSYLNSNYTQMSLYDFMLFDEISTDDKIKELNKYVGIEGNVWGILTQLSNSTLISNETLIKNE